MRKNAGRWSSVASNACLTNMAFRRNRSGTPISRYRDGRLDLNFASTSPLGPIETGLFATPEGRCRHLKCLNPDADISARHIRLSPVAALSPAIAKGRSELHTRIHPRTIKAVLSHKFACIKNV